MARSNYRGGTARRAPKDLNRRIKKKPCALCRDGVDWVDYKDVSLLRKFMSDRGKIRSRRVTGNCAQHQRDIAEAIKNARELVLLPYTQRTVTERPGARAARGERGSPAGRDERGRDERAAGSPVNHDVSTGAEAAGVAEAVAEAVAEEPGDEPPVSAAQRTAAADGPGSGDEGEQ
jgi:small subunit ribosomal protein S18